MLSRAVRQQGVALVVGLIMLTVLTLMVVTAIKIGILELKIGGVSYLAAQNFANAELAIGQFIDVNADALQPGCTTKNPATDPASCLFAAASVPSNITVAPDPSKPGNYAARVQLRNGSATLTATEMGCGADAGVGSGNQVPGAGILSWDAEELDIRARSSGSISGLAVIHQGIKKRLTAGGCGN